MRVNELPGDRILTALRYIEGVLDRATGLWETGSSAHRIISGLRERRSG